MTLSAIKSFGSVVATYHYFQLVTMIPNNVPDTMVVHFGDVGTFLEPLKV